MGLRGVWPPFPEIGHFGLFHPCPDFLPFSGGLRSAWKIQKGKVFFLTVRFVFFLDG